VCPPNTDVTVSAIYKCRSSVSGVGPRAGAEPLHSATPDRRPATAPETARLFSGVGAGSLGSLSSSVDFKKTRVVLITPARRRQNKSFPSLTKLS
jgi:hypothetical protein